MFAEISEKETRIFCVEVKETEREKERMILCVRFSLHRIKLNLIFKLNCNLNGNNKYTKHWHLSSNNTFFASNFIVFSAFLSKTVLRDANKYTYTIWFDVFLLLFSIFIQFDMFYRVEIGFAHGKRKKQQNSFTIESNFSFIDILIENKHYFLMEATSTFLIIKFNSVNIWHYIKLMYEWLCFTFISSMFRFFLFSIINSIKNWIKYKWKIRISFMRLNWNYRLTFVQIIRVQKATNAVIMATIIHVNVLREELELIAAKYHERWVQFTNVLNAFMISNIFQRIFALNLSILCQFHRELVFDQFTIDAKFNTFVLYSVYIALFIRN